MDHLSHGENEAPETPGRDRPKRIAKLPAPLAAQKGAA
jgi:hypothetical protein